MIGLLLATSLIVNAPECDKMSLSGNTITVSECGEGGAPQPTSPPNVATPTPKPVATSTPGAPVGAKCDRKMDVPVTWARNTWGIGPNYDSTFSLAHGYQVNLCTLSVPAGLKLLKIVTNDKSNSNGAARQCAMIRNTTRGPSGTKQATSTTGGDLTISYYDPQPGVYYLTVEDLPGGDECHQVLLPWWQTQTK